MPVVSTHRDESINTLIIAIYCLHEGRIAHPELESRRSHGIGEDEVACLWIGGGSHALHIGARRWRLREETVRHIGRWAHV